MGLMLFVSNERFVARYMLFYHLNSIYIKEIMMKKSIFQKFENLMTAVTFAERGEHDYAIRLMDSSAKKKQQTLKKKKENPVENRPQMRL
jgi:hypothetical protein